MSKASERRRIFADACGSEQPIIWAGSTATILLKEGSTGQLKPCWKPKARPSLELVYFQMAPLRSRTTIRKPEKAANDRCITNQPDIIYGYKGAAAQTIAFTVTAASERTTLPCYRQAS